MNRVIIVSKATIMEELGNAVAWNWKLCLWMSPADLQTGGQNWTPAPAVPGSVWSHCRRKGRSWDVNQKRWGHVHHAGLSHDRGWDTCVPVFHLWTGTQLNTPLYIWSHASQLLLTHKQALFLLCSYTHM